MFKKVLSLVLALLMLATVFVGCSNKNTNIGEETSTKATAATTIVDDEEDETEEVPSDEEDETEEDETEEETEKQTVNFEETNPDMTLDGEVDDTRAEDDWTIEELLNPKNHEGSDIPDDRDYEGYEFKMLVDINGGGGMAEFLPESDGDLVKDKIIERREMIEEYLGVSIHTTTFGGGYGNMEGYAAEIEVSSGAGTPYDLSASYCLIPPVVAAKGLSRDLAESENLNLYNTQKPYWGKEIKEEIMVNGRIFWMSDNSSWSSIRAMTCIFVNKSSFEVNNPGLSASDLYNLVDNKTWTMDNMLILAQNAYNNSNTGDETTDGVDSGDEFGLCATFGNATLDTWLYAAGFRSTKLNSRGTYDWAYGDQPVLDFIDSWQEKLLDDDVLRTAGATFVEGGRAIFMFGPVSACEEALEYDYTVLPTPFYSSNVKNNYSTTVCNVYTSYLIPKASKHEAFERSATVLELIAAGGNQYVAPAYFEVFLKRQVAGMDNDMFRMFNIIRNSIVFDIGYLYGSVLTYERPDNKGWEEPFIALRRVWSGDGTGFYSNMNTVWTSIRNSVTTKLNDLMVDIVDY